ncbi:DUF2778 domain-containing protein [Pseudorhodoplanes sp.]|uniref:DUF2778 domain-containing protein n=1 Tax=Pseudorhodoplanes sp. TaxID=1934341 RepID=UPI002D80EBC3|nr:DUF2778 domain-containing protein [Pseudorhodoplanes sp.]
MTRATTGRRVKTRHRSAAPLIARIAGTPRFAGSLARGAAAVAIGFAIVTGTLTVAGWLLSITTDAKEERRSTIGLPPQSKFAWLTLPAPTVAIASTVPYITRNWPDEEDKAAVTGSVEPRTVALPSSGFLGGDADDPIFSGMPGHGAYHFERRFSAVTNRFEQPVRPAIIPPMIIPRTRPKLAALPPAKGLAIPDEDPQLAKTAIYDINAKAVYMPNGEKLEAHSGYGQYMDDPKHVKLRMRGVTPPNTYRLTMRESRFHGVEAIRMNPEDRDGMFGRNGILVHPYMLGPNGQSNGCVSIKDYPKFLAAFKRGEVNRMIVVFRLPEPPATYARRHMGKTAKAL